MKEVNIASLLIIMLLSIACNLFAIYFIKQKRSETTMKDRIITLLCLINLTPTIGFVIELYAAAREEISDRACAIAAFSVCTCTYSAIGCFVALMFERYTSIVHPFKYVVVFASRVNNFATLAFPLFVGVLLGGAPLVGWGKYGRSRANSSTYCGFDFEDKSFNHKSYFYATMVFSFLLPLTCTAICFGCIICDLRRSAMSFKRQYGKASTISRDSNKAVHQQYVSSLLTTTIYVVSWVPYAVVCFLFFHDYAVPHSVELFSIYMSKSATVTSPVIFCLIERRVVEFVRTHSTRGSIITLTRRASEKPESNDA